jgi:hypothetical protein
LLDEFTSIRKEENETVSEFNTRFSKLYNKIPQNVRPNSDIALLYYFKAFDVSFGFLLREKELHDLDSTLVVATKIEKNIMATEKVQLPLSRLFDPLARRVQQPKEEVVVDK